MMTDFYGITCNPFDKNNLKEKDAFVSQDHEQMCQRLEYLRSVGSVGVFTAPAGMGKTYALRCFFKSLRPNLNETAYVQLTTVSVTEFYGMICEKLGLERSSRKAVMFQALQNYISDLYFKKRRPLILAIDEAQHLAPQILFDLKMLLNYEYDSKSCFSLILLGEPQLTHILQKPIHEALRQRITVSYSFSGLTEEETSGYIVRRLERAGGSSSLMDPAAIHAVRSLSQGNPRKIDIIMTHALTIGAQMQREVLDAEVIRLAAENNIALR